MSLSAAIFILIVLIIVSAILSSAEISLAGASALNYKRWLMKVISKRRRF